MWLELDSLQSHTNAWKATKLYTLPNIGLRFDILHLRFSFCFLGWGGSATGRRIVGQLTLDTCLFYVWVD